jgi:4-hydroxy-3-methylbut-2-enyl diphosphate reductase
MGVRRAVEMVLETANRAEGPVYTFGPLIHNPQVMDILREKGVSVLDTPPESGRGTVLIRAHGVGPEVAERLEKAGFTVVDATCPRVRMVQRLIQKHVEEGWLPVIAGDADHPEVMGLVGHSGGKAVVIRDADGVDTLPDAEKILLVAQTTQDTQSFVKIRERLLARFPEAKIKNTICDSTRKRQDEIREMAKAADAIVVVGGKNSGNTRRLAQIAKEAGVPAWHVEGAEELDLKELSKVERIGVTAGASTPNWIIRAVLRRLENPDCARGGFRRTLGRLQRFLVLTNIYVGLGAGALAWASGLYRGAPPSAAAILIACSYVISMHLANNFIGANALRTNDPDRAGFYALHRRLLLALAVGAGIVGVFTGTVLGALPFGILLCMMTLGLLYNVRIVPKRFKSRYIRLRAVPGSKAALIAVAWGVVCALLPALAREDPLRALDVFVFVWACAMVFVRSAFFDFLDVQVDRIVGQETFATWIGEKRTLWVIQAVLAVLAAGQALAALTGLSGAIGLALLPPVAAFALLVRAHTRDMLSHGYRLEFLVETNFVFAGALAWAWSAA